MDTRVYNRLRDIVYQQSGIKIRDGKMSMVASRLARRLRALNIADERAYIAYLENALDQEIPHLLDAISTNVTSFFRENHHFTLTEKLLVEWIGGGQRRFRLWSAAASTGEEPYTLAMTLREACRQTGKSPDMRILATDISTRVLEQAQAGEYEAEKLESVPPRLRKAYFTPQSDDRGPLFRAKDDLKRLILFRRFNLSVVPYPMPGPMDIIFCRNVMIYFDQAVRERVLAEFRRLLKPGGYLMLGHSESMARGSDGFEHVGTSTYRKQS